MKAFSTITRAAWGRKVLPLIGLLITLVVSGALAGTENPDEATRQAFFKSHQLGARLGGWSNLGGSPPEQFRAETGESYQTDFGDANFYLEGYFGYRINPSLMVELSLGIVSRGDVVMVEYPDTLSSSVGTMQVYPILAKLKLFPFGRRAPKLQPYLMAGGGFYYGRHDIMITAGYDAYLRQTFGQDSKTDFSYVLGGGFDWPLASVVALDLHAQYMPVKFSSELIGVSDYSSFTVTVGVKYLFFSEKEK